MELLIKALRQQAPPLNSRQDGEDPPVPCRIVIPGCSWAWYPLEFDGHNLCYGFVDGDFPEFGSFRLTELQEAARLYRTAPQLDPSFTPCRVSHLLGTVR